MKRQVNTSGALERWVFWPPVILLVLIVAIYFGGFGTPLFLALNYISERAGDVFWIGLTTLGDGLVVCVRLLPFVRRKPELVWSMVLSLLLVALYVKGIKNLISVPRPLSVLSPADFHVIGAPDRFNSFPSGHAAVAATFAATFCFLFKQKWARTVGCRRFIDRSLSCSNGTALGHGCSGWITRRLVISDLGVSDCR